MVRRINQSRRGRVRAQSLAEDVTPGNEPLRRPSHARETGSDWFVEPSSPARRLGADRARQVAALAAVLVRVARADLDISGEESVRMAEIVRDFAELPEDQARLVVELATELRENRGGAQDYTATRALKRLVQPADRDRLLRCLFAVTAADDSISLVEEEEVRQIASELGFEHRDYTRARAEFREQREVLRGAPGRAGGDGT